MRWLTTGLRNHRWVGAWHRWEARKTEWMVVDPDNRMCINHLADNPPHCFGRSPTSALHP